MATFLYSLFTVAFAATCVFLILLILIQKGRGGGLSGAFGGAGGNTAFGSKTGDVLTWVTSIAFGLFVLLAMALIWTADAVVADNTRLRPAAPAAGVVDNDDLPADTAADQSGNGTLETTDGQPPVVDDGDDTLID